jgi:hypothetical protein
MSIADSCGIPRLRWYAGRGVAQGAMSLMTLSAPPHLGFQFVELDYQRGICGQLRENNHSAPRELFTQEIEAVERWLRALD